MDSHLMQLNCGCTGVALLPNSMVTCHCCHKVCNDYYVANDNLIMCGKCHCPPNDVCIIQLNKTFQQLADAWKSLENAVDKFDKGKIEK